VKIKSIMKISHSLTHLNKILKDEALVSELQFLMESLTQLSRTKRMYIKNRCVECNKIVFYFRNSGICNECKGFSTKQMGHMSDGDIPEDWKNLIRKEAKLLLEEECK